MPRLNSDVLSNVRTLFSPDKSAIESLSLPRAEFASKDMTSRTDVLPVPLAPIITQSGRRLNSTFCKRRKPSIERFLNRVWLCVKESMALSVVLSGPLHHNSRKACYVIFRFLCTVDKS